MSASRTRSSNSKDYYLNYLNHHQDEEQEDVETMNRNHNNNNMNESTDSSYVPNREESSFEDCYIEDYSRDDYTHDHSRDQSQISNSIDASREDSVAVDPILPPPSYLGMVEGGEASDDSVVESDESQDEDSTGEESQEHQQVVMSRLRSAAGGSYLSMDAAGNVVQSFSMLRRSESHSEEDEEDFDEEEVEDYEEDAKSISSVPRTALPPPSDGTNSAASLLSSHNNNENEEEEEERDISYLLPPPNAEDYAPAEFSTPLPKQEIFQNDLETLQVSRTIPTENNKENQPTASNNNKPAFNSKNSKSPQKVNTKPVLSKHEKVVLRAEEEQEARKLATAVESPPPQQHLPPDHYSHLLQAYEFVEDPSIPPLPPAKEFVMSPTDEKHMDAKDHSPDTSYEDDIEVGTNNNNDDSTNASSTTNNNEANNKSNSIRPGVRAGLLNIFSPPAAEAPKGKNSDKDTPDTETLSPPPANYPNGGDDYGYSGRQLFTPGQHSTSYDTGYEGDSDMDTAALKQQKKKRRRCWTIVIALVALILGAAIAVIAYAMIVQNRQTEALDASSVTAEAVLDIAKDVDSEEEGAIVIEVNNQTTAANLTEGDFEWVTTTAPFDSNSLRPVTNKVPTGSPSAAPTSAPTLSFAPTPFPTSAPTNRPTTGVPTAAPVYTMPPTNEGDFVGHLQALLQARDYRAGPNGDYFVFDFSTNESLDDPANKALIYMAREFAAVMELPDTPYERPAASGNPLGNVAVTFGDETLAPTTDPNFYPILLKNYEDDKLVQRFALLTLQFAAASAELHNPFAGGERKPAVASNTATASTVAEPMKRIVFTGEELEEANTKPTQAPEAPFDPASLADPKDVRFLVDECDWHGIECVTVDNTTETATIVTKIRWDYKDLDGSIAPSISLLKNLVHLDMSNNNLQGSIPESLYELTDLEEIFLFKNELSGTLSKSVGNLDKLRKLHLSHNALTGSLPTELKSDAGSVNEIRPVEYFNIYSNQFTGSIPTDLRWRQCVTFDVGRNQLTGTLPEDLGEKFISLRHLFLDHNAFSGTLPESYNTVGNGRLVAMALEYNQLSGVVPGDRENYDTLVQYTLHENNFVRLEPQNCENYYLVEFKADCGNPNVCTCYGGFFQFCERWCGNGRNNNWQQRPPPNRNWSF